MESKSLSQGAGSLSSMNTDHDCLWRHNPGESVKLWAAGLSLAGISTPSKTVAESATQWPQITHRPAGPQWNPTREPHSLSLRVSSTGSGLNSLFPSGKWSVSLNFIFSSDQPHWATEMLLWSQSTSGYSGLTARPVASGGGHRHCSTCILHHTWFKCP